MTKIVLTKPDDWHIHLRDGDFLKTTVAHAARCFERVIVMPNLKPPVFTTAQAKTYYESITNMIPPHSTLQPLMTLYLTDQTTPQIIEEAKSSGLVFGCKLYPAGSTTHSDNGVTHWENLYPALEKMAELDLPLLIHGEVTHPEVDIFDREAQFLEEVLLKWRDRFPSLRMVVEHITTREAVQFVQESSTHIAATITAHHLLLNRNALFAGGIKPHHYCLPVLKRSLHQEALIQAATSGNPKFFLGTDSAPHTKETKESDCGCAGIYTAHAAIELYCEAFEEAKALDKLEGFASFYGPDFYRLPRNRSKVTLIKEEWTVPNHFVYGHSTLIPFRAGNLIRWRLQQDNE